MVLAASAGADSAAGRAVSAPAPGGPRGRAGPAAEHDTRHAVAALLAALGREDLAVLAPIDALDLPDIGLDADGVELLDRAAPELRGVLPASPSGFHRTSTFEKLGSNSRMCAP